MKPHHVLPAVAALLAVAGCQSYRDFATQGSNAFHEIAFEISPEAKQAATIENLRIERKAQAGSSFHVSGDVAYPQSCKTMLSVGVSFVSVKGVVLLNRKAPVMAYVANSKARFNTAAHINAKVGEDKDIIDKVIITEVSCL